jgi:hypothetical protein
LPQQDVPQQAAEVAHAEAVSNRALAIANATFILIFIPQLYLIGV